MKGRLLILTVVAVLASGCMSHLYIAKPADYAPPVGTKPGHVGPGTPISPEPGNQLATFAGGYFADVESHFRSIPGVKATAPGYTGGEIANPHQKEVMEGKTGHAEAVLVEFDPKVVSYAKLLDTFFKSHDPTTVNQQGIYTGTAFRSAVFYHSIEQRNEAAALIRKMNKETGKRIVTFVAPAEPFYLAEEYNQQAHAKAGTVPPPAPFWR